MRGTRTHSLPAALKAIPAGAAIAVADDHQAFMDFISAEILMVAKLEKVSDTA